MKNLTYLLFLVANLSCISNKHCSNSKTYYKKNIDYTKPYKLKGAYCIVEMSDTVLSNNRCVVEFNVFDRRNGNIINDGVIRFYGQDTLSVIFDKKNKSKLLTAGRYSVEAWENGYIETKTRILDFKKNKRIIINFYLGTTMIY